jgi:hypothetical protein
VTFMKQASYKSLGTSELDYVAPVIGRQMNDDELE